MTIYKIVNDILIYNNCAYLVIYKYELKVCLEKYPQQGT